MGQVKIPWGPEDQLAIHLPDSWRVVIGDDEVEYRPLKDLKESISNNLDHPYSSQPLRELITPQSRIALVMDDDGRPTPVSRLAPVILDYMIEAGANPDNIIGLFAIGTHAVMSDIEMVSRAGTAVYNRIKCVSVECHDQRRFVNLGRTSRGTPVWINRLAVEADLVILVGTIEPHPQAGFGGGYKNMLPGLAGVGSIAHNHLLLPSPRDYNMVGTRPEENPMRLDLEEAGALVPGKAFLVNVVLDPSLEPVVVVCGDPIQAHRVGIGIARKIYEVKLPGKVDVVIASSFPMDQDLRQSGKAILNVAGACRPGGLILAYLKCDDGMKNVNLPAALPPIYLSRKISKVLGSRGIYSLTKRLPKSIPGEDRFMITLGLNLLKDFNILLYSPKLAEETGDRLQGVIFADQQEMLEQAMKYIKVKSPEIAVFKRGGVSYPSLEN
jgi:nickel-dependent lactate racemase